MSETKEYLNDIYILQELNQQLINLDIGIRRTQITPDFSSFKGRDCVDKNNFYHINFTNNESVMFNSPNIKEFINLATAMVYQSALIGTNRHQESN